MQAACPAGRARGACRRTYPLAYRVWRLHLAQPRQGLHRRGAVGGILRYGRGHLRHIRHLWHVPAPFINGGKLVISRGRRGGQKLGAGFDMARQIRQAHGCGPVIASPVGLHAVRGWRKGLAHRIRQHQFGAVPFNRDGWCHPCRGFAFDNGHWRGGDTCGGNTTASPRTPAAAMTSPRPKPPTPMLFTRIPRYKLKDRCSGQAHALSRSRPLAPAPLHMPSFPQKRPVIKQIAPSRLDLLAHARACMAGARKSGHPPQLSRPRPCCY